MQKKLKFAATFWNFLQFPNQKKISFRGHYMRIYGRFNIKISED